MDEKYRRIIERYTNETLIPFFQGHPKGVDTLAAGLERILTEEIANTSAPPHVPPALAQPEPPTETPRPARSFGDIRFDGNNYQIGHPYGPGFTANGNTGKLIDYLCNHIGETISAETLYALTPLGPQATKQALTLIGGALNIHSKTHWLDGNFKKGITLKKR